MTSSDKNIGLFFNLIGFTEYTYNADATVKKEHCVYKTSSFSEEEYDLEYTYTYRNE